MTITTPSRAEAVTRAKVALAWLEAHPSTTRSQLGAARDRLNDAHYLEHDHDVWDAIFAIEGMVCEIYGGRPD